MTLSLSSIMTLMERCGLGQTRGLRSIVRVLLHHLSVLCLLRPTNFTPTFRQFRLSLPVRASLLNITPSISKPSPKSASIGIESTNHAIRNTQHAIQFSHKSNHFRLDAQEARHLYLFRTSHRPGSQLLRTCQPDIKGGAAVVSQRVGCHPIGRHNPRIADSLHFLRIALLHPAPRNTAGTGSDARTGARSP